jgi:phospholipase C
MRKWTRRLPFAAAAFVVIAAIVATTTASASGVPQAKTPIKHVVVIFQENVSFDHYFGTYPYATGTDGNAFTPKQGTPAVNGLNWSLLAANPNSANPKRLDSSATGLSGSAGGQLTCDMDHNYSDEQQAFDGGKMDQFVQSLGGTFGNSPGTSTPCSSLTPIVMDYYDGNTVTGLWNYAQNYAMSDNSFETTFGPSSPGAINLASGNTGEVDMSHTANSPSIATSSAPNADLTADGKGGYSLTSDAQPYWDDCSTRDAVAMKDKNIGDLLNKEDLSWGWFQGGFAPTDSYQTALANVNASGQPTSTFIPDEFKSYYGNAANRPPNSSNQGNCDNVNPVGVALGGTGQYGYKDDYIPHHEPFQYYASTANPHHLPPASLSAIGRDTQSYVKGVPQFDTANHQYDTTNFDQLVSAITADQMPASALPAVSFIKAPGYQDGHAAYSDPADEQQFVVHIINELEQSPDWSSTAVFINYDDSDGWYDHVYTGVTNPSASVADNLTNGVLKPNTGTSGLCGTEGKGSQPLAGEQGRCGFGNRLPMLVISPYAKQNHVDHNLSDQSSIINFVESNWGLKGIPGSFDGALAKVDKHEGVKFDLAGMFDFGAAPNLTPVLLDPNTGEVVP